MSSLNDSVVIKNITHVVKRKYIPTSNCWRENWKGLIFLLFATYVKIEMIRKERGRSRWVRKRVNMNEMAKSIRSYSFILFVQTFWPARNWFEHHSRNMIMELFIIMYVVLLVDGFEVFLFSSFPPEILICSNINMYVGKEALSM